MKQSENTAVSPCILCCCAQRTLTLLCLTGFRVGCLPSYSKNANIVSSPIWAAPLVLPRESQVCWLVTQHQHPCLTTSWKHFLCIVNWFEIIVKQQNLTMTASFPCVLIKTTNIMENPDIKLSWRNRVRLEDIKL